RNFFLSFHRLQAWYPPFLVMRIGFKRFHYITDAQQVQTLTRSKSYGMILIKKSNRTPFHERNPSTNH
ncbi:MAG TPA: hypothetical protein PKW86_07120, partial [bacterium]|nr:hypothetical protein [bacterium]